MLSVAGPGGMHRAVAGWLLLLPCWTRSTPSFLPPGGMHEAGLLLLLLYWTRSTLSVAPQVCGRAADPTGLRPRLSLRCWVQEQSWSWTAANSLMLPWTSQLLV